MLALEVDFLTGVSVAATPSRREETEWPPHPDRLFLALVAAWGRNEEPDKSERDALEWLEGLDPDELVVSAPAARDRNVVSIFVPPNDARTARDPGKSLRVIPEFRKNLQPRTFPATLPLSERPVVRYTWKKAHGTDRHRMALKQLAAEVTYLGHSHSLVRVALIEDGAHGDPEDQAWIGEQASALRMPYRGRLAHLVEFSRPSRQAQSLARPAKVRTA
jgi:CRISPR-associated protein Csb2